MQSLDAIMAVLRGIGEVAAVLLRCGDEHVAPAELRPATRGKRASGRRSLLDFGRPWADERIGERLSENRCCLVGLRHFRYGS